MLNAADTAFADALSRELSDADIRPAEPRYNEEPRGKWHGIGAFVARPNSVETVGALVRACNDARVGIVPYGGGTGLVSGQIAFTAPTPLIVSLERLRRIRETYREEQVIVAEAGVALSEVQDAAKEMGLLFPLSYASEQSARIGGALSVNSGGLNVLRYGMARDLCLGIEAVLPDGQILHGLKRLRKDNTGYDIRNLLIGAEGTLGIITAAALRLVPRPAKTATAFFIVDGPSAALSLLSDMQARAGGQLSAFELISGVGLGFLAETYPDVRQPFASPPDWSVLIELDTGPDGDPEATLLSGFEDAVAQGLATDGRIAQNESQRSEFWAVRESMPEANRAIGAIASHDISLPLSEIPAYLAEIGPALQELAPMRINCFGHLGDGNLHYNAFPPKGRSNADYTDISWKVTRIIHDAAIARGGSFSAEHGIGRAKAPDLQRYGDPARLHAMRAIKDALDPNGIMNPGAVLPV